jgi:hypothetical protein
VVNPDDRPVNGLGDGSLERRTDRAAAALPVRVAAEPIEDLDRSVPVVEHTCVESGLRVETASVNDLRGRGGRARGEREETDDDRDGPAHA